MVVDMNSKSLEELQDMLTIITNRENETRTIIAFFEDCGDIDIASLFDEHLSAIRYLLECLNNEIASR